MVSEGFHWKCVGAPEDCSYDGRLWQSANDSGVLSCCIAIIDLCGAVRTGTSPNTVWGESYRLLFDAVSRIPEQTSDE